MEETQNPNNDGQADVNEIEALKNQRDEYLAGWQRAKADFINYKRDEAQRLEQIAKYQMEDFIYDLITVMDNFDLGLAALEKQGPVEKGIYMIRTQLEDILKRRGLVRIPIRAGDPFDPAVAEAIAETDSEHPAGAIVEVIEAGYKLHDKVIRPVRVKVSKAK
jgi:molecular chaperone GrpE